MPTAGMWVKSLGEDAAEVETKPAARGGQGRRHVGARAGGTPGDRAGGVRVVLLASLCGRLGMKCVGGARGGLFFWRWVLFREFFTGSVPYRKVRHV
jgi:hypothetical protein